MKRMMIVIVLCVALAGVSGCATNKAALCQDAQLGIMAADLALEQNPEGAVLAYWKQWRIGAVAVFNAYCLTP